MSKTKTTEEFIEQAKSRHGGRYEYHKVDYRSNHKKVTIICRSHGEFPQNPSTHLSGHGCPKCGKEDMARIRAYTTDDFIQRSKEVHGNKYDYSLVRYTNSKNKVKIICKIHGSFYQVPSSHVNMGQGCLKCAYEVIRRNKFSSDLSEFILKSKHVHGDKYDYSESNYINNKTKVKIICPIHGVFLQSPASHTSTGRGCPQCGGTGKLTTELFIERVSKLHNNKYDYSQVSYVNIDTLVDIICPIHGLFSQLPIVHLYRGSGCSACQLPLGERVIITILSSMGIDFEQQKRFKQCRNKQPLPFDFYFRIGDTEFLVEYDGPQHFFPIKSSWGNMDQVRITQYRDSIKTTFAASNGFHLIRIPYTEFDNIESILRTEIERHTQ